MKINCYYVTLDEMINGLNTGFSQETLGIISIVGNRLNTLTESRLRRLFKNKTNALYLTLHFLIKQKMYTRSSRVFLMCSKYS